MNKSSYNLKKQPVQMRARATVDFIKQAATHILKEKGLSEFTTNHVAEKAGVSIGSLYQYFPSKEVLIAEIKRDHFAQLRVLIKNAYQENIDSTLDKIVEAFIVASIAAHQIDPELHRILTGEWEDFQIKEDDNSKQSVRFVIEELLIKYRSELRPNINISLAAKLTYKVVESMTHDTVLNQPQLLLEKEFVEEIKRMVMSYLKY